MKVFLCSDMKENLKLCCLYKGAEVKSGKLWELLTVRAFLLWFVLECLLKTHTSYIFNYWSHIIAEKYKVGWKSPLCLQKCCGFHTYSTEQMPAQDPHGQRVWSRKMLLPTAIALGKQHGSTSTCTSRGNDGLERKGECTSTSSCLSRQLGTLPNAQQEPATDPSFFLCFLDPPNHRHLCCLARNRDKENFVCRPLSAPAPSLFTGLYHSSTLAPKDSPVTNADQAAHAALLG